MRSNPSEISLFEPEYEVVARLEGNSVHVQLVVYGKSRSDCKFYERSIGYSKASSQYYMNTIFKNLSDKNLVKVHLQTGTIELIYTRQQQRQIKTLFTLMLIEKPLLESKVLKCQAQGEIKYVFKNQNKNNQEPNQSDCKIQNINNVAQMKKSIANADDDEEIPILMYNKYDKPRKRVKKDPCFEKSKIKKQNQGLKYWKICKKNVQKFSVTRNQVKYEHDKEWCQIVRNKKLKRKGPTSQFDFEIISTSEGKIAIGVISQKRLAAASSYEHSLAVSQIGFGLFKVPSRVKVVVKWDSKTIQWVVKNEKTKVWIISTSIETLDEEVLYPYVEMYDKGDMIEWVEEQQ